MTRGEEPRSNKMASGHTPSHHSKKRRQRRVWWCDGVCGVSVRVSVRVISERKPGVARCGPGVGAEHSGCTWRLSLPDSKKCKMKSLFAGRRRRG